MATPEFASHAGHSGVPAAAESAWNGGGSPFAIGSKKLGMWLFIVSDAITFSALLVAYSYVRVASNDWPTPFHFYPSIIKATVMTVVLLTSSVTMVMAVRAAKLNDRSAVVKWLLATMLCGVIQMPKQIKSAVINPRMYFLYFCESSVRFASPNQK